MNTESSAAQTLCGQCFARQVQDGTCGACGTPVRPMRPRDALPLGTPLNGKFDVGNLLGDRGGFGLVYLGWDRNLRRKVVIKELLPDGLVMRQAGSTEARVVDPGQQEFFNLQREMFLDEARKLAQFDDGARGGARDPVLCGAERHRLLRDALPARPPVGCAREGRRATECRPAAGAVVAAGRRPGRGACDGTACDIKPENVLIDDRGKPVLIDFGNAMFAGTEDTSSIGFYALSRHFAAPEQYVDDRARMGPWTDVYALCGLMFFCLTGQRPSDAAQRANSGQTTMPPREGAQRARAADQGHRTRPGARREAPAAPTWRRRRSRWRRCARDPSTGCRPCPRASGATACAACTTGSSRAPASRHSSMPGPRRSSGSGSSPTGCPGRPAAGAGGAGGGRRRHVAAAAAAGLLAALALGAAFTGAFGDLLHYRRVATLGASLQGESAEQRQHAQQALLAESRPDAARMLAGLVVPLGLAGTGLALEAHEADVRAQVERAMALGGLRERVAAYVDDTRCRRSRWLTLATSSRPTAR